MLVRDRMTRDVLTATPSTPISEALTLMRERRIRRLPVVDGREVIAIVSWTDLMRASPSPATTLSKWEIPALLEKAEVRQVMTRSPVVIAPDAPIEEAARLMRERKFGGLPVVEAGDLVGIITESDVMDALLELLGARRTGARLTIELDRDRKAIGRLAGVVEEAGVGIVSLCVYEHDGRTLGVLRVDTGSPLSLVERVRGAGVQVRNIRLVLSEKVAR